MPNCDASVVQKLENNTRVDSGVLQVGQDWPGLFIRGDHAFGETLNLIKAIEGSLDCPKGSPLQERILTGLIELHLQRAENLVTCIRGKTLTSVYNTLITLRASLAIRKKEAPESA